MTLFAVVTSTVAECGAVQEYQTDLPPALPAWLGSPVSFVAPTFLPYTVVEAPVNVCRLAKLSLSGADWMAEFSERCRFNSPPEATFPSSALIRSTPPRSW